MPWSPDGARVASAARAPKEPAGGCVRLVLRARASVAREMMGAGYRQAASSDLDVPGTHFDAGVLDRRHRHPGAHAQPSRESR